MMHVAVCTFVSVIIINYHVRSGTVDQIPGEIPSEIYQAYIDPFDSEKEDDYDVVENYLGYGETPVDPSV